MNINILTHRRIQLQFIIKGFTTNKGTKLVNLIDRVYKLLIYFNKIYISKSQYIMTNAKKIRSELSLEVLSPTSLPIEAKIMEFKEDPEKMDQLRIIIDDIVANAQKQAELKVIDNKVHEKNIFNS